MELEGKVAIVTGGSRRIGASIAVSLGQRGAVVMINYLKQKERAEEVAAQVESAGGRAMVCAADVRDRSAVDAMAKSAVDAFGGIDILINNARTPHPVRPFLETDWKNDVLSQIEVHLGGAFHCCQACVPHMKARGGGAIVNMLSISFRRGNSNSHAYGPAKAALRSLTMSLAAELGESGIRVNSVSPSTTKPERMDEAREKRILAQTPLGRFAEPEEIAETVAYLCSDSASYITGVDLPASGGRDMTI